MARQTRKQEVEITEKLSNKLGENLPGVGYRKSI